MLQGHLSFLALAFMVGAGLSGAMLFLYGLGTWLQEAPEGEEAQFRLMRQKSLVVFTLGAWLMVIAIGAKVVFGS